MTLSLNASCSLYDYVIPVTIIGSIDLLVKFFLISISFTFSIQFSCSTHSPIIGGITGRGNVGKNPSTRSKTTVRSKRGFPLKVRRDPFTLIPYVRSCNWKEGMGWCVTHLLVPLVIIWFLFYPVLMLLFLPFILWAYLWNHFPMCLCIFSIFISWGQ